MNKKERFICWAGVIAGTVAGTLAGSWLSRFELAYIIVSAFACFGILALAVPVIGAVIETRNEARTKALHDRPANWGFDKSFE